MLRASIAAAVLALAATGAAAQSQTNRPGVATVCVDVNGALRPPACRQAQASRIDLREDICTCPTGVRIEASVCPPGVAGPPDSLAANRARNEVLRHRPDLVGAMWEGRPLCVAPREP